MSQYVFIDDIGSVECYGRERANLQNLIRARIQKGQWTFLTIDSMNFDPDLKHVLTGRAVDIWIDK